MSGRDVRRTDTTLVQWRLGRVRGDTSSTDHLITTNSETTCWWSPTYTWNTALRSASCVQTTRCVSLWPCCLAGVGILIGDLNMCDPEERRFNVATQSFYEGDPGGTAVFPHALDVAQPNCTTHRRLRWRHLAHTRELTGPSSTFRWRKPATVHLGRRRSTTWGLGPYRAVTL